jgi:hypothetical protein
MARIASRDDGLQHVYPFKVLFVQRGIVRLNGVAIAAGVTGVERNAVPRTDEVGLITSRERAAIALEVAKNRMVVHYG